MNWVFVDLDCTLIDTREMVISGGVEPEYGTPEHAAWVDRVTHPDVLATAPVIPEVEALVAALQWSSAHRVVLLTNRKESLRNATTLSLETSVVDIAIDIELVMRPEHETLRAGKFKERVIRSRTSPQDTILIVDDDPDGSVEEACRRNGWVHFKPTTYRSRRAVD